ncbi:hypothetical protein [Spongiivirga citrea]|uniref:Uncharacterized protein n=1 Tax=Spongiivirga citrea TaxID=1481457 RepID=A0A6M0CZ52_9FLAO|nr:hypothetical protein [Spongiivirga citrea]NER19060.1 hypothetical protein [Spongiivirga citrea]
MKTRYITLWCMLLACLIQAQSFKEAGGLGKEISLDKTGRVFVIGNSGNQFIFNVKEKRFVRFYGTNGVGGKGVSRTNSPYQNKNVGSYANQHPHDLLLDYLQSQKYKDVSLASKNALWVVKPDGNLYFRYNNYLKRAYKGGTNNKRIALTDGINFYTVKNDNSIWLYHGSNQGTKLPGKALDIAYDHKTKNLYCIGISKRIFKWNTHRYDWDLVKGTRNDFKYLSVHNNMIWAVAFNKKIYSNDINGAVYDYWESSGNKDYKLKITLEHIYCEQAWDNDKKDDYMISFKPTIKVNNRNIPMEDRKLNRIARLIQGLGAPNSLYISQNRNSRNHAAVQLHTKEKTAVAINNSGVFEISSKVNQNNAQQFLVDIKVDEVSNQTINIINIKDKLNLIEILKYLDGTKILQKYRVSRRVNVTSSNYRHGGALVNGTTIYYDMGRGFKETNLTLFNNKPVAYLEVKGSKKSTAWGASNRHTKPKLRYKIELID